MWLSMGGPCISPFFSDCGIVGNGWVTLYSRWFFHDDNADVILSEKKVAAVERQMRSWIRGEDARNSSCGGLSFQSGIPTHHSLLQKTHSSHAGERVEMLLLPRRDLREYFEKWRQNSIPYQIVSPSLWPFSLQRLVELLFLSCVHVHLSLASCCGITRVSAC